jgi:hypothetical protein
MFIEPEALKSSYFLFINFVIIMYLLKLLFLVSFREGTQGGVGAGNYCLHYLIEHCLVLHLNHFIDSYIFTCCGQITRAL